jgi:hypothetical protein
MDLEAGYPENACQYFEKVLVLDPNNREATEALAKIEAVLAHKTSGIEPARPKRVDKPATMQRVAATSTVRKRSGCLTAYLIFALIGNPLVGLYYLVEGTPVGELPPTLPAWHAVLGLLLSLANFVFVIAIWKWKRWGVYGLVGSALVVFLLNVISVGILPALLGLALGSAGIGILASLLGPAWHQMD